MTLIIPKEVKIKLKSEIRSELLEELGKREIKLDSSSVEFILAKTQSLIESQQPRFDNEELVVRLLKQVKLSEGEKQLAFNKDRILSREVRTDFINDILDKIVKPKDGKEGTKGQKGNDGKNYILNDQDKLDIAEEVNVKGLMTEDLFNKRNAQLIKDIQNGKIRLPNRSGGANGPEIIAKIDKALQTTDWQNGLPGDGTLSGNLDSLQYTVGTADPASPPEGYTSWNDLDHTMNISTGLGPILQVGQEFYEIVYNDTPSQIDNLKPVYVTGASNGRHTIAEANNTTHEKLLSIIVITTMDIPSESIGIVTRLGLVRDIDTSDWDEGDRLYVDSTDGGLINVKPSFPDYVIAVGHVLVKSATEGVIHVHSEGRPGDTVINFWNGVFRETINFTVSSDGDTATGSLSPENGHPNMTMMFSDGLSTLIATPPATIVLTSGTDSNPQENFVYIPKTTKVLTVSTSGWPTTEHIKVATLFLRSATATESTGPLVNHNWNDHIQSTTTNQGHLAHICEKLRQLGAQWDNGIEGSMSGFPTNVYVSVTSGETYQLHKHSFPSLSNPSDDIHVVNNFANPYETISNINTQTLDALGNSLANSSFSFVVWGSQTQTSALSHLMLNLPTGSYSKNAPANAVADAFNFSVYDIPKQFQGSSFLIARFTLVLQADGTTWSIFDTEDLRGKIPNTTAGGGAGGGGVTTYLGLSDTPSSYTNESGKSPIVNNAETGFEFLSGWNDLTSSLTAGKVTGGAAPTWAAWGGTNIYTWQFAAASVDSLQVDPFHFDHDYKIGTNVYPHIHWKPDDTNTGVVRWGIEFTFAIGHGQAAFSTTTTTIYIEQAGSGTQYMHQIAEVADPGITLTGLEPDTLVQARIFRDATHANDTYTGVAHGLTVDMHYEADRPYTFSRSPDFYTP
jgi:hypothetical protein